MGCLKTRVWTCLGTGLGGCPFTVTLCHRKASVHSIVTYCPQSTWQVVGGVGTESCLIGFLLRDTAPGTGVVPCHTQPEMTGVAPEAQYPVCGPG